MSHYVDAFDEVLHNNVPTLVTCTDSKTVDSVG